MNCVISNSMEYCYSSSSSFSSSSSLSSNDQQISSTDTNNSVSETTPSISAVHRALSLVLSDGLESKLEGAREIRTLTKTSRNCRRLLSDSVAPLASMLRLTDSPESNESALLALLNLAVRDELNKAKIIEAGALEPIIGFLSSEISNLQEYAAASLLTLSASANNKAIIGESGAIPPLVETLKHGTPQAKVDAVTALSNLSTDPENLGKILAARPVPAIVDLLKLCKNSSRTAEKCCSLMESLAGFHEARVALTSENGGVFSIVEVLENGSLQGREHAVGVLLAMCRSDRCRYREPILREGAIPGLLEMTILGTPKSKSKAQTLLGLLRESEYHQRSELQPDTLENIVCDIISQIDGVDQSSKARKMLAEMVQVSMEQSLRHLQQRALVCTPTELPIGSACPSEVSLK